MFLDKAFAVRASQSLREGSQERRLLGFACHCNRTYFKRMPWHDIVNLHYLWIPYVYSPIRWKCTCNTQINTWCHPETCVEWQKLWVIHMHVVSWGQVRSHSAFTWQLSYWEHSLFLVHLVPHCSRFCFLLVILLFERLLSIALNLSGLKICANNIVCFHLEGREKSRDEGREGGRHKGFVKNKVSF